MREREMREMREMRERERERERERDETETASRSDGRVTPSSGAAKGVQGAVSWSRSQVLMLSVLLQVMGYRSQRKMDMKKVVTWERAGRGSGGEGMSRRWRRGGRAWWDVQAQQKLSSMSGGGAGGGERKCCTRACTAYVRPDSRRKEREGGNGRRGEGEKEERRE
jgi:hypothetical protein